MAKEGTDDLFGFAELTGDFVPPPQPQTRDNNNKGTYTKKPLDTDSIKGVKMSDISTVRSDSKSVSSVAVEIAASASTDSKTQCSVEGLTADSGISAEQKPENVDDKPTLSKFTPPTTPSKLKGKQPFSKPSPKGVSSVESSPLSQCSVVIKKNPILDKLPRQNSYENVYAYVNNDKIEIKGDSSSEETCKERERKISSSESESSVSSLNRLNSSDKKLDHMVYNANIEVRKSGRLKSSKCSSRYRGDYGIRAEVYTKLTSSKKSGTVTNESKVNVGSLNVAKDIEDGSKEVKVNFNNANVTEPVEDKLDKSELKNKSDSEAVKDIKTSKKDTIEPQSVIQKLITEQKQTNIANNELLRQSGRGVEGQIENADNNEKNDMAYDFSVDKRSDSVKLKLDSECGHLRGDEKIKKNIQYTDLKSKQSVKQKPREDTPNVGEGNQQRKPSVIQTRRSSGKDSSQKCDVPKNKNVKEASEKLQVEKPVVLETLESKTADSKMIELDAEKILSLKGQSSKSENFQLDQKNVEKEIEQNININSNTKSNNERPIVKQLGCDTKVNQTVNVDAIQKQGKTGSMTRLKLKQKIVPVKKKVGPKFRTHLTLQSSARNDDTNETLSSLKIKQDILPLNELGSTSSKELRTELTHSALVACGSGNDEFKIENITKDKQNVNKDNPLHPVELEKSAEIGSLVLTGKDEQLKLTEQSVSCDISKDVPSQSNILNLIPSDKQKNQNSSTMTTDENTVNLVLPIKSSENVLETSKPTITESVNNDRIKTNESPMSTNIPVFKFYKTKEKTPEKTTNSSVKSNVSAETSVQTSVSSEITSSDSSVSLLESLRLRLFESAGVKAIEVVDKPKVFESKIKQPKVKKSQPSDKVTVSPSKVQPGSDTYLNKTYSDSESNKSSVISSKSSNRSGHSTPRSSSPSSEILDEVSRTLEGLQKVKQKREKSLIKKPKKPKFSQKMFLLRSMIPKQMESDSESHSSLTTDNSDDTRKLKESERKEVKTILKTNLKKKSAHPLVAREVVGQASKSNAKPVEKVDESIKSKTLKTNEELNKKQLAKPKPAKCHACAHIFKSKDLLKRHYPCLMRQTRRWSQNKLRPNRVFRYVERPPKEQGSKKFICLLPKSRKQEQNRPRPQLFTYTKTKFKRVKGKRRRRLYNILQGLAGKRQPKTYPHLHVNYENLTRKSQFLYNLGLFDPESVDHSSLRDYYTFQKSSIHADSDQTDKENKIKMLSQKLNQDLNTSQESMLSLTDTFSDLRNAEQEFEKSQLSDFIDGRKESSSSETEAPPVLERFGSHNNIEIAPVIDPVSDSDSNGPPLLELQFESPTKKTHKERHFLDFVENVVRKDKVKEDESDLNSAEFKISMKNIAKLKDAGSKAGTAVQRHFTDFIALQDVNSSEIVERSVKNDNFLWEKSEDGEMTLAEIKEMLKPRSSKENMFSKETLLNLRSDLAKLLSEIKTPAKKEVHIQLPEKNREPSEEKTDLDKLGIDFSAYERKSLFETLENVDASNFDRQVSQEDHGGYDAQSESLPEQEHLETYKSSPEYEQDLLPATYGESDSLDSTSKGGITDNILQMLNKLEDKGSVAENMSNLLQILAENLGIVSNNQEDSSNNNLAAPEEEIISSFPDHCSTVTDSNMNRTEFVNVKEDVLSTNSKNVDYRKSVMGTDKLKSPESVSRMESIHGNMPDISVTDSAFVANSETTGHGTTASSEQHEQLNKVEGVKESSLFKSITELNSIETDSESNLGDSYDAESMSKRLAELKATNYDASASDINSDMLSDSETVSSEKSKDYELDNLTSDPSESKMKRPILCISPTARRYDSDILESEEEIVIPVEERPRLIMKIKVPAGASFDKSDDSSHRDSSSSTSASAKSSDASDIEDGKSEDETLVEDQSVIENDLNTTIADEENDSDSKKENKVQNNEVDSCKNEQTCSGLVEKSPDTGTGIEAEDAKESSIMRPEHSVTLMANLESVAGFKSNEDLICDNEIMFPKKLKLNTALTIGDSFDYESDSTSSFEREVTVVPHVGMSPRTISINDVSSGSIQPVELDSDKQECLEIGKQNISIDNEKVLLPEIQESPVMIEPNEDAIRNIHNEFHDTTLPLAGNSSLPDRVETDSLNESQVIENILDMETKFPIHEEIPCYTAGQEINDGSILNQNDQTSINTDTATVMFSEDRNPYLSDTLPRNLTNIDTNIKTDCQTASTNDAQIKISQEIHSDVPQVMPVSAFDHVLDSNLLPVDEISVAAEVTCSEQIAESVSNLPDVQMPENGKENNLLDASTLGPIGSDDQLSDKQSVTEGDHKRDNALIEGLNTISNDIKMSDDPQTIIPVSKPNITIKNLQVKLDSAELKSKSGGSSEKHSKSESTHIGVENSKSEESKIPQVHTLKSNSGNQSNIQKKSGNKSSKRRKTKGGDSSERVESERETPSSKKPIKNKQNSKKESVQTQKTKSDKKELTAKNIVPERKVKFSNELKQTTKKSNLLSSKKKSETVKSILKNTETDKIKKNQSSKKLVNLKPTLETTELDKFSFLISQPSAELEHVAVKPILKNTDINKMNTQTKHLSKETPTNEAVKPILKNTDIVKVSTPEKQIMPSTVKSIQNTDIDKVNIQSKESSKEIMPDTVKPILKNKEIHAMDIQLKQVQDNAIQSVHDNILNGLNSDSDMNKGNITNIPISPVIADESDASRSKSVLKGNGVSDNNSKEEQNKKRRISFTDYLSRVKKGDNTKKNEEQKYAKVPLTLHDENKTVSETKAEPRPHNVKSPEIVIDENMYETKQASENWHSFSNIKKPQERAPALKKLERSNSAKNTGSTMPSFMPLPDAGDDSIHELDMYDKGKTDSKRFVSMPLTKKSDIFTLENTLGKVSESQEVVPEPEKQSPEPEEQDDVLSVFDSLFSLGETVLNLNKSLPKASVDATPQEEESFISTFDTARKTEDDPASEGSLKTTSSCSDSVPSKSPQGKSKNHTSDIIDLTDEPERYHRTFFLEMNQWILQSGSVENITTESPGKPKGIQEGHLAKHSDPGYYFGKMGSFSGSYLSRFRYNISVFEEQCKNLGNKIVVVKEASPVKSIPFIREVKPVEIVGKTDTYLAMHKEIKDRSFEQDSIEVTEAGNEDYMDDDYADMLAAAQMALMEEAQNQTIAQLDNENISRNVETISDKTDEGESKMEEVEKAESGIDTKKMTETSTGEAVEILNSLVKTLSADIETYNSDTESKEVIEAPLDRDDEKFKTNASSVEESVKETHISEKHVDEFIDSVSKLAEEVLVTTKESISEIQSENKPEEKNSNLNVNSEKMNKENSVILAEIPLIDFDKAIPVESNSVLLEKPPMRDSEHEKKENVAAKKILPQSELGSSLDSRQLEETTNTSTEKSISLVSSPDVKDYTEESKIETNEICHPDEFNKATQFPNSDNKSIENEENKISSIEIEETFELSSNTIPSIEDTVGNDNEIINNEVPELIEKEALAKDIDGHTLKQEKNKPETIGTEIDNEEKNSNDKVDEEGNDMVNKEGKVTSDDLNEIQDTETDLSASENEKSFVISDSIRSSEKGERFDLAVLKTMEEKKKPPEEPENEKLDKEEIQEAEKTSDKPNNKQQSSLVSMDYDAISDGSFSEDETRKSDRKKPMSKTQSDERETSKKNKSFSKDSYDRSSSRRMEGISIHASEKLANTKDKGRRKPTEDELHSTEEMGRKRSDSWDAANYRVEHKKKRKKEKRRQAVYDSESDDHVKREKKKKTSQASKKYKQSSEIFYDDVPEKSKKYRKGKEFVDDNGYYTTYRKGKAFVEEDDYYEGNRKNRASRNRTDSFDDMKNKIYEDFEKIKRKDKTKYDTSKDKIQRDYSEERINKDSFDAIDYRVDKHRKKDRRREMPQSDAEEFYNEDRTKLKSRKSRKHSYFGNKNYDIDHENEQKKGRTSVKRMERDDDYSKNDKQKVKNSETKKVSTDRSRSYEAGESELKEKENRKSSKILQDTGIYRLEQKSEKREGKGDNESTKDRDLKQSSKIKDSEFENKTLDTGKGQKSMQRNKKDETSEDTGKSIGKSYEMEESKLEKKEKETSTDGKTKEADGVERKRMNVEIGEFSQLTEVEVRKSDTTMDIDSGKNAKQKNKDIEVIYGDEDDYYERKKEKKKDKESRKHSEEKKIENSAEQIFLEDKNSVEKKRKEKTIADDEIQEFYEKETKKEKGREKSKSDEDKGRSYSTEVTALEHKTEIESRKSRPTAIDDEYSVNKKEKRKSGSKSRDLIENEEEMKTSIDVIDDEYYAKKVKHKKDREYKSPHEKQKRKSELKETETLLYEESIGDCEDLDYEDIEHYDKEKDILKHKEHKKSKKSRDLKDFEYESVEETVRKNKADLESEDEYYESKRMKKKEKMKDKVEKLRKEMSESDEEYENKKTKKKEKIRDEEEKLAKHTEEKLNKHREISDSEEEYQRKNRKKKDKQKVHADRKSMEAAEVSDYELKSVKKKEKKRSRYSESDSEYYETKKVKDKHAKRTKHKESKYYEDDEIETEKHRKNTKSVADKVYEKEKERKKDRKQLKLSERKEYDITTDEKDRRKQGNKREFSENKDIDYGLEKRGKKNRNHKEFEGEDYEEYENVKSKKKDKKKRYSVESDEEREIRQKDSKKRKVSIVDDDYEYRKEKKKKKEKKRSKSTDSEELQYYEEKRGKMKDKRHKMSSERTDDFEDHKNEKKKHQKRHQSEDSIQEFSPEDRYSSKKGKMVSSAVKISKSDRYDEDSAKWADSGATVDVYERQDNRSGRDKYRGERDFDKYDQGRLERGDLRHALKSKKLSR